MLVLSHCFCYTLLLVYGLHGLITRGHDLTWQVAVHVLRQEHFHQEGAHYATTISTCCLCLSKSLMQ